MGLADLLHSEGYFNRECRILSCLLWIYCSQSFRFNLHSWDIQKKTGLQESFFCISPIRCFKEVLKCYRIIKSKWSKKKRKKVENTRSLNRARKASRTSYRLLKHAIFHFGYFRLSYQLVQFDLARYKRFLVLKQVDRFFS